MDGVNEHQGWLLELERLPRAQLQEMLFRQEKLQHSGLLRRMPDGGRKGQQLLSRLKELLAKPEVCAQTQTQPISVLPRTQRVPTTRRFLPSRKPPEVPEQTEPSPAEERNEEKQLAEALGRLNFGSEDDSPTLEIPTLSQTQWNAFVADLSSPSRPRPALPRQAVTSADPSQLRLVLMDALPDPSRRGHLLQLSALPLTSPPSDPVSFYCPPSYISPGVSQRCGLSLSTSAQNEPPSLLADRTKVETMTEEAAAADWLDFALGRDGSAVLLLLPPPVAREGGRTVWAALERAPRDARNPLLLELGRSEWAEQLRGVLGQLPQDLNCNRRCCAVRHFLMDLPGGLSPSRLADAGRVVRLCDRLALSHWLTDHAARRATFLPRVAAGDSLLSSEDAELLAAEGWDHARLNRAFTAGWPGFACAILGPWSGQAVPPERLELAQRLFRQLKTKFRKMELHCGELLPSNTQASSLVIRDGCARHARALTLAESIRLTQEQRAREAAIQKQQAALRLSSTHTAGPSTTRPEQDFLHSNYREKEEEEEEDSDSDEASVRSADD